MALSAGSRVVLPVPLVSFVAQALQSTLSENMYNPKKVNDWTNTVIDGCLKGLQTLNKSFKYIGVYACSHSGEVQAVLTAFSCSDVHHHAEERGGIAHDGDDVLGRQEGRVLQSSMGEQHHALHCDGVRSGN